MFGFKTKNLLKVITYTEQGYVILKTLEEKGSIDEKEEITLLP